MVPTPGVGLTQVVKQRRRGRVVGVEVGLIFDHLPGGQPIPHPLRDGVRLWPSTPAIVGYRGDRHLGLTEMPLLLRLLERLVDSFPESVDVFITLSADYEAT